MEEKARKRESFSGKFGETLSSKSTLLKEAAIEEIALLQNYQKTLRRMEPVLQRIPKANNLKNIASSDEEGSESSTSLRLLEKVIECCDSKLSDTLSNVLGNVPIREINHLFEAEAGLEVWKSLFEDPRAWESLLGALPLPSR